MHFNKGGGQIVQSGSLEFLFNRKTVIQFEVKDDMDMDEIELNLIDAGLEELEVNDGQAYIYGELTSFDSLSKACSALNIEVSKAGLQRIPTNPTEFTEEQLEEIESLIDRIEDDEDVQAVYTNIA